MVDMAASTVAMANPFFSSIGLLQRLDVGMYAPSEEVIEFASACERNIQTAAYALAPAFRQAWFSKVLLPKLADDPIDEEVALSLLMEESSAGPEYRKALGFLLDLMVAAGVVKREKGRIVPIASPIVVTHTDNGVQLCVSVQIDAKDLAEWAPDQIDAFLGGLVALITAKREQ